MGVCDSEEDFDGNKELVRACVGDGMEDGLVLSELLPIQSEAVPRLEDE